MKLVAKVLVIAGAASAGIAGLIQGRRTLRARKTAKNPHKAAGVMFVGAVDEVELGRGDGSDTYDPPEVPSEHPEINELLEVPSEHPEINELRTKMPMG